MATPNTSKHVLHTLSQEYKTHLTQVNRLEHTLKQQQTMMLHKSIPKMYQPKVLTSINPIASLTEDFNKEYRALFFKHLERVMTNNNIALEVKKARLTNILTQVDHYLSSCGETPNHIAKLYDNFIMENQITREVPELKKYFHQDTQVHQSQLMKPAQPTPQHRPQSHNNTHNAIANEKAKRNTPKQSKPPNKIIFYP